MTSADARRRLAEHGPNALKEAKPISPWAIFFAQFKSVVIWILIGACVVSAMLGEALDAFAILAIVVLNAVVGFYQEFNAEKSIAALKQMTAPQAKVWRDGAVTTVGATEIVPGDILEVQSGDLVAADARLLSASSLACVEAALTGESEAVAKSPKVLDQLELAIADRENMIFMGASVAAGVGRAVVVATAMQTEIGGIATLISEASGEEETPLQQKLEAFGRMLLWATLGIVVLLFTLGLVRGTEIFQLFLTSVSLAVAALPESLPAVVTAALSLGVMRMSRRRALVRRLASVETLGSTNVICTDKTGTLTVGQMTVRALFVGGRAYEVTGEGYGPEGEIRFDGKATEGGHAAQLRQMAEILIGCNNAHLELENGAWKVIGDPTDGALLSVGYKAGVCKEEIERGLPRRYEIPFDSDRKRHSVVRLLPDGRHRALVNGAPELLLSRCAYIFSDVGVRPLTDADRAQLAEQNAAFAGNALRVLGSAFRDFDSMPPDRLTAESVERDLVFVGLSGLYDPPRPEAKAAVSKCHAADIRVVMITGDQPRTAVAIARELGIADDAKALSGVELDKLTDDMLREHVPSIAVYARVSAEHKLRIVRAWQANGAVVAMTGDGVNDAPAIKGADIGIAMGRSGAEVTKQASDMILTDDNFATIVAAVEEGRGIYENIRKTLQYLLGGNTGELMLMTICVVIGLPAPLLPIHLLWINLVTDGLPALALAADRVDPEVMKRRPRTRRERIVDSGFFGMMLLTGVLTSGVSFAAYVYGLKSTTQELARTYAFSALVFAELLRAFGARSETRTIWRMNMRSNVSLLVAIAAPISIQVWSQHNELLASFFKTTLISYGDGLILLSVSALPLFALEGVKLFSRPAVASWRGETRSGEGGTGSEITVDDAAVHGQSDRSTPQSASPARWGRQIAAASLALLCFGSGWLYWSRYGGGAVHYVTEKLERGSVVRTVTAIGIVNPTTATPVVARASGVIHELYCDTKTKVKAGQLCAKIDPRPYQLFVDQAKADLAAAEARLEKDKADLAPAKAGIEGDVSLSKRRANSRKARAKLRKAYARAQEQMKLDEAIVANLQAALHVAEANLRDADVISPVDGMVVSRNVEIGQTVAPATRLFLVATDLAFIRVDANVSAKDIGEVKLGDKATFRAVSFPSRNFTGEVTQIRPSPHMAEQAANYDIVIAAPNPDLLLEPGMTAAVRIVTDRRHEVLRTPDQALRYSPGGSTVPNDGGGPEAPPVGSSRLWILRDKKLMAIPVELGLGDGAYTEIVKGDLLPGDEVIVGESRSAREKTTAPAARRTGN
ncbi:HAD-IC family P-type ATPase [Methylocapsa polymorpha]|uniref:HAD-IC family P-type ATPase n=1 Tax=Methylocapsa polymorpha TaxID=3080828 RepID=A0ABZ0HVC0_9HYPH|nr:HAD-IC family P-type ATPase [Methylocapsa sp. RX1]